MTTDVQTAVAELKKLIGVESEEITYDIEKGHMRRFAEAIGDSNPLWRNEVEERKSRYGGVIAPPTFLRSCSPGPLPQSVQSPFARNLDGGSEWDYFEPVRPGDRITAKQVFAGVNERPSRLGPLVIMTRETRYTNQFGQLVAIQRNTMLSY